MEGDNFEQKSVFENEVDFENLVNLIQYLFVPEIKSGFDQPIGRADYEDYLLKKTPLFIQVLDLLQENSSSNSSELIKKYKKKLLSSAIIVWGQHTCHETWTSETTLEKSEAILSILLNVFGYSSLIDVIIEDECYFFKDVLAKMRPWLLKDTWKNYPAAVVCYSKLLVHVKSPHISNHLNIVLPTALIITDDFETGNRLIGINCLKHIVEHVAFTHLSWYGQDKVVFKAIEPLFYCKDVVLIQPVAYTFLALLQKKYPLHLHPNLEMNEFDDLIGRFLQSMIFEQKLDLRSAYMSVLPNIIAARGLGMVLHSFTLITIISEYALELSSSLQCLKVLKAYIEVCWPRIQTYSNQLLIILSKICLGSEAKRFPVECRDMSLSIIKQLHKLNPENVDFFFQNIKSDSSLRHVLTLPAV